jgi:hypothetical protein
VFTIAGDTGDTSETGDAGDAGEVKLVIPGAGEPISGYRAGVLISSANGVLATGNVDPVGRAGVIGTAAVASVTAPEDAAAAAAAAAEDGIEVTRLSGERAAVAGGG